MTTILQAKAIRILVGPPAVPATVVAKELGVNKGTVSRWIHRWLDEGRIIEDPNAIEISSWITGGRPPKIYIEKYSHNKGGRRLPTNLTTKSPDVITSPTEVEPSMILEGNYARPHSGAWICRGLDKPKTDLAESKLCVHDKTINGVRTVKLDYTDGWRVHLKEGPRKRSLILYPPSKELSSLTTLDDFIEDREKKIMNIWGDIVRTFGFDYKFLDQMVPMEIGVPVADEGLARETGERITTVDGDMWVDRSEEAIIPGAIELEGDAPVMRGLAKMPDSLHDILIELRKGRKSMSEETHERLERLEKAVTKLVDGDPESETDEKDVGGYA
tara:strand:+ start:2973 stop:3962 length:990 start_codon:yes stop_codon:yes gene_type:complete